MIISPTRVFMLGEDCTKLNAERHKNICADDLLLSQVHTNGLQAAALHIRVTIQELIEVPAYSLPNYKVTWHLAHCLCDITKIANVG